MRLSEETIVFSLTDTPRPERNMDIQAHHLGFFSGQGLVVLVVKYVMKILQYYEDALLKHLGFKH